MIAVYNYDNDNNDNQNITFAIWDCVIEPN